jgi:hypothetical protein
VVGGNIEFNSCNIYSNMTYSVIALPCMHWSMERDGVNASERACSLLAGRRCFRP